MSTTREAAMARVRGSGIVGIVRTTDPDTALEQASTLLDVGLTVVEVSLTTPGAVDVIRALAGRDDATVGAGTVLSADQAQEVIDAGAGLIVSPDLNAEVVATAVERGVACIPGCLTPSEMLEAMRLGASAVKVFPAHLWSPQALSGMLQALPALECVPTGGVSPHEAPHWIAAGAVAVGVGSSLTSVDDPAGQARRLRATIDEVRRPT